MPDHHHAPYLRMFQWRRGGKQVALTGTNRHCSFPRLLSWDTKHHRRSICECWRNPQKQRSSHPECRTGSSLSAGPGRRFPWRTLRRFSTSETSGRTSVTSSSWTSWTVPRLQIVGLGCSAGRLSPSARDRELRTLSIATSIRPPSNPRPTSSPVAPTAADCWPTSWPWTSGARFAPPWWAHPGTPADAPEDSRPYTAALCTGSHRQMLLQC